MARVVDTVASRFGGKVEWTKVITKEMAGAMRLMALAKKLGRPAPVPSIFIDGELAFESTPGTEELHAHLERLFRL